MFKAKEKRFRLIFRDGTGDNGRACHERGTHRWFDPQADETFCLDCKARRVVVND